MKRKISVLVLVLILSLSFAFTAFATGDGVVSPLAPGDTGAKVVQKSSFSSNFNESCYIYTIDGSVYLGSLTYGYKQRSVLPDQDYAQCWTEFDWRHSAMVITGIGTTSTNTKNSGTMTTHGVATAKLNHKGPKVSYGGEITAV